MVWLRAAGEETLKRFIAKRKEALRLCDEEARKRYAASAKDIPHQPHADGEPLGRQPPLATTCDVPTPSESISVSPFRGMFPFFTMTGFQRLSTEAQCA